MTTTPEQPQDERDEEQRQSDVQDVWDVLFDSAKMRHADGTLYDPDEQD